MLNLERKDKKMPKVSVIVSVFNVKEFLTECIRSIIHQTYKNIEVILVDDGSTDGSGEICDRFKKLDERVVVVHKENEGPSFARKVGIDLVSGEFVVFVDGDDWIDQDTIEKCLMAYSQYPTLDCVLYSYVKEYENLSVPVHVYSRSIHMKGKGAEYKCYRRLFGLYGKELSHPEKMEILASCCMKMYPVKRAKKGVCFNITEIGSSEDALFNMYALFGVQEAVYIDRCFYHYRKRDDSITNTFRPHLQEQWKKLFQIMCDIIEEKSLDYTYRETVSNRIALSVTAIALNEICNREHIVLDNIKEIHSYLNDSYFRKNIQHISVRYMPVKWKVFMIFAKLRMSLAVYLMSRVIQIFRRG